MKVCLYAGNSWTELVMVPALHLCRQWMDTRVMVPALHVYYQWMDTRAMVPAIHVYWQWMTLGWWFSYACVLAVSDPAGPLISPPLSKLYMCTHDIEVTTEHLHWAQLVFEAWHLRQNSGSLWTMLSCTQTNLTQLDSCWIVFCAWHTHLLGCGVKGWINPYSDSQVCNMVYINILQCIMAAQICTCFPNCFGVI